MSVCVWLDGDGEWTAVDVCIKRKVGCGELVSC